MTAAPLSSLFYANQGNISDKWEQYLAVYEAELKPWHGKSVSLLEIGVQNGGSMQVWAGYFGPGSQLVGIDIDDRIADLAHAPNVELRVADGTKPDQLYAAIGARTFDIIIDDGSHFSSDIANSFRLLFSRLNPGGRYFVEDLHCSYWDRFGGGLRRPESAIEFLKNLVDVLHVDHLEPTAHLDLDVSDELMLELRMGLGKVTFYDSVAVIERLPFTKLAPFRRVLAGEQGALVDPLDLMRLEEPGRLLFTEPLARSIESGVLRQIQDLGAVRARNEDLAFEASSLAEELLAHRTNAIAVEADRQALADRLRAAEEALELNAATSTWTANIADEASANAMRALASSVQSAERAKLSAEAREYAAQAELEAASRNLDHLQLQLDGAAVRAADFGSAVVSLRHRVDAIERSSTYKLMAPVRLTAQLARRAKRITARLRTTTNHVSGQALELIKGEGFGRRAEGGDWVATRARAYDVWRRRYGGVSGADRRLINRHIAVGSLPSLVVLIRVDSTDTTQLSASLQAISDQWFPDWNASITIDPQSRNDAVTSIIAERVRVDQRFHLADDGADGMRFDGAVTVVTATSCTLAPHALYLFSDAVARGTRLAYGDSELIDAATGLVVPFFKPAYSPLHDQLHEYIGTTVAIDNRQSTFTTPLTAFVHDGLTVTSLTRVVADATADDRKAIERLAFVTQRSKLAQNSNEPMWGNITEPVRSVKVSIIIPTRDRIELLEPCVVSVLQDTNYPRDQIELIVVDNGSSDPATLEYLSTLRREGAVVVRDDGDFNYPRLNNRAADVATGEVLVLLNNDTTVFDPDWLRVMVDHATRPGVGAVGAKLLYPDLSVQHGGVVLGIQGVAAHVNHMLGFDDDSYQQIGDCTHEVAAVTGACLAIRAEVFRDIGGLDESLAVAFNDIDLCCAALAKGYRNVYIGAPLIIHHESKSRGYDVKPEQQEAFRREAIRARTKHPELYGNDPYYNPNLSLLRTYELAEPPRTARPWVLARRQSEASRCILMLSSTHQVGHGVAVVVDIQARHLASLGHRVVVGGPRSTNDFAYKGCERVVIHNELEAANLAYECGADLVIMHTPPFFSTSRWLGDEQVKIAYDYGEPNPDFFPDAQHRRNVLADKRFSMALADHRFAISEAVRAESDFTDMGVIPLGNGHLATWGPQHESARRSLRKRHGWVDKLVVFNVCRFHGAERNYKGVDAYAALLQVIQVFAPGLADDVVFVLCGKGDANDVIEMEARGLTVFANVSDAEMTDLYAAADVYVNLSLWEGYNLGIGQALAMGLPTLASDIPAHRAFGITTSDDVVEQIRWLEVALARCVTGGHPRQPRIWPWSSPLDRLTALVADT